LSFIEEEDSLEVGRTRHQDEDEDEDDQGRRSFSREGNLVL
jgi:hypothetical protein